MGGRRVALIPGVSSPHPAPTIREYSVSIFTFPRQVEFKANCTDFRRELYLLGKTYAAKMQKRIKKQRNSHVVVLFYHDFGGWGPPGGSLEEGSQKYFKTLSRE